MSDESRPEADYPTCSTCPFWRAEDDDGRVIPPGHPDRDEVEWAECHGNAPAGRMERDGGPLFVESARHSYAWPTTAASEWCAVHPLMDGYIKKSMEIEADRAERARELETARAAILKANEVRDR